MGKLKIAQVTRHFLPIFGGQERYVQNLDEVLNKNNFETTVFQPEVPHVVSRNGIKFIKSLPLIYRLSQLFKISDWFLFNADLKRNIKALKKYDLVICHYSFHYPVFREFPKVIVVSHGILWSKNKNTDFDIFLYKQDHLLKSSNNTVVVANDTDYLRTIGYDIEPGKHCFEEVIPNFWFIPNCVDTEKFSPSPETERENIILIPRNIRFNRGTHMAIEAFNVFNRKMDGYKMIILGEGDKKYFKSCIELVKKYNLGNKIIFEGRVPPDMMVHYYQKAKVTLIPTIEKEGTSYSALESMACGTPVVATAVGGLLDLPCIQVEVNPTAIADVLVKLLDNDYEQVTSQQLRSTRDNFNMEKWTDAWLKVINKTMAVKNGSKLMK